MNYSLRATRLRFKEWGGICLTLSMALLLAITSLGLNTVSASSDVYTAYAELEQIQSEQGFGAAEEYFNSLPEPVQKEIAIGLTTVTFVEETSTTEFLGTQYVTVSGTTMLASCWARTDSVLGQSVWFSANLWRYYVTTYWCGNGSITTSSSQSTSHAIYNWLWWYEGNDYVGSLVGGCNGCLHAQLRSRGIFAAEVPALGTVQKLYPWVKTTGYGNGWSVYVNGG